jgi:CheY-like chemotaxis protein
MNKIDKKILAVEDDQAIQKALTDKLRFEGFSVYSASDGKKALELAKSEKPDMILLDLILPEKDGLAVLEELQWDSETKDIPVIVLSNVSNEKVEEQAKGRGVVDFMVKADWRLDQIVEKIKETLKI